MNTTFDVKEGQIVKLFHNRPEDAYTLDEAPREFLEEFCAWNDRNGEFDGATKDELVSVIKQWAADDPAQWPGI